MKSVRRGEKPENREELPKDPDDPDAIIILFLTGNGIATERRFQKKSVSRPIANNEDCIPRCPLEKRLIEQIKEHQKHSDSSRRVNINATNPDGM
jgi:hypothetical protein